MPPSRCGRWLGAVARVATHPCQCVAKEGIARRRTRSPPDSSSFKASAASFTVGHVWIFGWQDGSSASPRCEWEHCAMPAWEHVYSICLVRLRRAGCLRSIETARQGAHANEQSTRCDADGRGGTRAATERDWVFGSTRRGTFAADHCRMFACV